jgi:hypothetical protein
MDKEFDMPLYSYLRVYTINSAVMCLFCVTLFTANSFRFFSWTYAYPTQFFNNYIEIPVSNTSYYFGTMLDLIITLDRISFFHKSIKKIFILGPYKLCGVILAFCIVTDFPFYFNYSVNMFTFTVNGTQLVHAWFGLPSTYSYSEVGKIVTLVIESFRDVFLLLAELALSVVSIYCLRKYFKNRLRLLINKTASSKRTNEGRTVNETVNQTGLRTNTHAVVQETKSKAGKQNEVSSADLRSTIMAIVICSLSMLEHLSLLGCVVYPYLNANYLITAYICFGSSAGYGLKHSANFFIFYFFNKKFSEKLRAIFNF